MTFLSCRDLGDENRVDATAVALRAAGALRSYRFRFATEEELQAGIERALLADGLALEREAFLGTGLRPDFLLPVPHGLPVAVEVKARGWSPAQVLAQLLGYAQSGKVGALILATSRPQLLVGLPAEISGVTVVGVLLSGGGLG